ncbi:oligopeptide/dipeptide ABC transporter ATP-binding protein [Bradyrhizobium sp.]|uniref:oligopeptide/dipeptide ABC transporter ATP-binding protein n=1 Tax=Bradyrhizobium sp. TaxID=376 RepID=UPI003C46AB86
MRDERRDARVMLRTLSRSTRCQGAGAAPQAPGVRRTGVGALSIQAEVGHGIPERGCRFSPRCPVAVKQCETDDPALRKLEDGSAVACHLA